MSGLHQRLHLAHKDKQEGRLVLKVTQGLGSIVLEVLRHGVVGAVVGSVVQGK